MVLKSVKSYQVMIVNFFNVQTARNSTQKVDRGRTTCRFRIFPLTTLEMSIFHIMLKNKRKQQRIFSEVLTSTLPHYLMPQSQTVCDRN